MDAAAALVSCSHVPPGAAWCPASAGHGRCARGYGVGRRTRRQPEHNKNKNYNDVLQKTITNWTAFVSVKIPLQIRQFFSINTYDNFIEFNIGSTFLKLHSCHELHHNRNRCLWFREILIHLCARYLLLSWWKTPRYDGIFKTISTKKNLRKW